MNLMDGIANVSNIISKVDGLCGFITNHKNENFENIINLFRESKRRDGELTDELSSTLNILIELYNRNSIADNITFVDSTLMIDDTKIINSFKSYTEEHSAKIRFNKAEKQRYKTITETIAYREVDYSQATYLFKDCNHPYVLSNIAIAYLNSHIYDIGLNFLQKALLHTFSYPNIYWHNYYAIYGCTDALYEFQHQLGHVGMMDISKHLYSDPFALLKLLYLFLSRSIYMENHKNQHDKLIHNVSIQRLNYLSMRADLVYDYTNEFVSVFGLGVNPEIQFIADKFMVYKLGSELGLDIIVKDSYNDAMKMYQHGSLIPNCTGGYHDIEDAEMGELIARGNLRSKAKADELYYLYKKGYFKMAYADLGKCIEYIFHMHTSIPSPLQ